MSLAARLVFDYGVIALSLTACLAVYSLVSMGLDWWQHRQGSRIRIRRIPGAHNDID